MMIFATRTLGVTSWPGWSSQNALDLWYLNLQEGSIGFDSLTYPQQISETLIDTMHPQVATTAFKMPNPFIQLLWWYQLLLGFQCCVFSFQQDTEIQLQAFTSFSTNLETRKHESTTVHSPPLKKKQMLSLFSCWNPSLVAENPESSGTDTRGSSRGQPMSQQRLSTHQCAPPELRHRQRMVGHSLHSEKMNSKWDIYYGSYWV